MFKISDLSIFLLIGALACALAPVKCVIDEAIEDCFDEDLELTVKNGESITPPGHCHRLTCFGNGFLHYEPCRTFPVRAGCKQFPPDLTKEYPMCCPHTECPEMAEIFLH